MTNEQAAWAQVPTQPLDFPAGQRFACNQPSCLLLGRLTEQLSGQSFAQFIRQWQPHVVGVPRTSPGDAHDVPPHGARGYTWPSYSSGGIKLP